MVVHTLQRKQEATCINYARKQELHHHHPYLCLDEFFHPESAVRPNYLDNCPATDDVSLDVNVKNPLMYIQWRNLESAWDSMYVQIYLHAAWHLFDDLMPKPSLRVAAAAMVCRRIQKE